MHMRSTTVLPQMLNIFDNLGSLWTLHFKPIITTTLKDLHWHAQFSTSLLNSRLLRVLIAHVLGKIKFTTLTPSKFPPPPTQYIYFGIRDNFFFCDSKKSKKFWLTYIIRIWKYEVETFVGVKWSAYINSSKAEIVGFFL